MTTQLLGRARNPRRAVSLAKNVYDDLNFFRYNV